MIHMLALGHAVITVGATRLTSASETLFAAALLFVSEAGRPLNRLRVLELLWPNVSSRSANHCLRQTVYRLNACGAALRSERGHIVLPTRSARSDCAELLTAGDAVDPDRVAELVQGPFLAGYQPHFSAPFRDWLDHQHDVVTAGLRRVLVSAIATQRERNNWAAVERLATRCLLFDPLNEEATLAIAEATALNGSKVRALEILDSYLSELGPHAGDMHLPASLLRHRIAETYRRDPPDRRMVPQVGREEEMRELGRVFRNVTNGRGATVLACAEPGMGKTRLLDEFTAVVGLEQVQIARCSCLPHEHQRPLSTFIELLHVLFKLPGAIGCSPESMTHLRRILRLDKNGQNLPDDSWNDQVLFAQLRRSVLDLVDAIAAETPLVLTIDDAQWLDDVSWRIVGALVPWIGERRVMIVLASRLSNALMNLESSLRASPVVLSLPPLSIDASRQLVRSLLAFFRRESEEGLEEWCIFGSGGNPFFLGELAEKARWDGTQFRVPQSIVRLVSAPLRDLTTEEKHVLSACVVLGGLATISRVESLLRGSRLSLLDSLGQLDRIGLIEVDGTRLIVRHQLLSQVALTDLSRTSSLFLHHKAAELLDVERKSDDSTLLLWECAKHWESAGAPHHSLDLLRSHARHLFDMGSPGDAALTLDRAARLARTSEEDASIRSDRMEALLRNGEWIAIIEAGKERGQFEGRDPLATEHTDAEFYLLQARWHLAQDQIELSSEALRCATSRQAPSEHRLGAAMWALVLADNACEPKIARAARHSVQSILTMPNVDSALRTHFEMLYHTSFGDLSTAHDHARSLCTLARGLDDPARKSRYLTHAAATLRFVGALNAAHSAATEALVCAEKNGLRRQAAAATNQTLQLCIAQGSLTQARELAEQTLTLLHGSTDPVAFSSVLSNCAEVAILDSREQDAEDFLKKCEQCLTGQRWVRAEARVTSLRWNLRLMDSGAVTSRTEISRLRRLYRQTRNSGGQDRLAVVVCRLLSRAGRKEEGRQLIDEYFARYRRERIQPAANVLGFRQLLVQE